MHQWAIFCPDAPPDCPHQPPQPPTAEVENENDVIVPEEEELISGSEEEVEKQVGGEYFGEISESKEKEV